MRVLQVASLALLLVTLPLPAGAEEVRPAMPVPTATAGSTEAALRLADLVFTELEAAGLRSSYRTFGVNSNEPPPLQFIPLLIDSAINTLLHAVRTPPAANSDPRWIATCNQPARLLRLLSLCQAFALEPALQSLKDKPDLRLQQITDAMEVLRQRMTPAWRPRGDLADPSLQRFYAEVRRLVVRKYPQAVVELRGNQIHVEYKAEQFRVHSMGMDGHLNRSADSRLGPNAGGFVCDASLFKGRYQGQIVVPQVLHEPYWQVHLNAPYSQKRDLSLWFSVLTPKVGTDQKLINALHHLAYSFEKHLPPATAKPATKSAAR